MRLFFAIELTHDVRARAAILQASLRSELPEGSYRWTKPDLFHVTLAFLGDVEKSQLPRLSDIAKEVCEAEYTTDLEFKGLNYFDSPRRPRVLWIPAIQIASRSPFTVVAQRLEKAASEFLEVDSSNAIIPHITLARLSGQLNRAVVNKVEEAVKNNATYSCGQMLATKISLMESNLKGDGPRYQLIEQFALKA